MSEILAYFFVAVFVYCVFKLALTFSNYLVEKNAVLKSPESSELCKYHIWKDAVVQRHEFSQEEIAELKKSNAPDLHEYSMKFCSECGYVPSKDVVLAKKYLQAFNQRIKENEAFERLIDEISLIREDYLQDLFKKNSFTPAEQDLIRKGYDYYDKFVEELPALLAKNKVDAVMKILRRSKEAKQ